MSNRLKIAFDVGGVLSKYEEFRRLCSLLTEHAEVFVIYNGVFVNPDNVFSADLS